MNENIVQAKTASVFYLFKCKDVGQFIKNVWLNFHKKYLMLI